MKIRLSWLQFLLIIFLGMAGTPTIAQDHHTVASAREVERQAVSLETLLKVKSRVEQLRNYVESRIEALGLAPSPGDDEPTPRYCQDYRTPRECRADSNCQWIGSANEGYCTSILRSQDENDSLAGLALLYLSRELVELGEIIDQAIFAYPSPLYITYVNQACQKANMIRNRAQAAKFSARLPPVGLITEAEFDPIIEEMDAVRFDLSCN